MEATSQRVQLLRALRSDEMVGVNFHIYHCWRKRPLVPIHYIVAKLELINATSRNKKDPSGRWNQFFNYTLELDGAASCTWHLPKRKISLAGFGSDGVSNPIIYFYPTGKSLLEKESRLSGREVGVLGPEVRNCLKTSFGSVFSITNGLWEIMARRFRFK